MILLGRIQTLKVVKKTDFGLYLSSEGVEQNFDFTPDKKEIIEVSSILLPKRQAKDEKI